ncbi:hypothetical protein [Litoribaculum gwangyangense]|jgi:hypothetical protein|uniref:Uncharacterized protein n=1 Tax=Litoribaculum gwangyangense TaxID=1130722 RepID=A0ABP9CC32_9FLAO
MKLISSLFGFSLFFNFSLYAQSLKNLEGTYLVEQDSIVHLYNFNNGKLIINLNIKDSYKLNFTYKYNYIYNEDDTLKVILIGIESEEIEPLGKKKKKKKHSYIPDLYMMSGYFFSVWTLEKNEDNTLFIKVIPSSIKWPASKGHLANYYSGFEDHIVLQPLLKQ